jgi:transposase
MNHMLLSAAAAQIHPETETERYYRRKLAAERARMEAMRCLKRRLSDGLSPASPAPAEPH